mmetsp:Transcript_14379/g.49997  ORF Transcript_14379/g.49997 Transcript_14379/m.49997 type:complete len:296 (+) Transcript_14379:465-1352(+)
MSWGVQGRVRLPADGRQARGLRGAVPRHVGADRWLWRHQLVVTVHVWYDGRRAAPPQRGGGGGRRPRAVDGRVDGGRRGGWRRVHRAASAGGAGQGRDAGAAQPRWDEGVPQQLALPCRHHAHGGPAEPVRGGPGDAAARAVPGCGLLPGLRDHEACAHARRRLLQRPRLLAAADRRWRRRHHAVAAAHVLHRRRQVAHGGAARRQHARRARRAARVGGQGGRHGPAAGHGAGDGAGVPDARDDLDDERADDGVAQQARSGRRGARCVVAACSLTAAEKKSEERKKGVKCNVSQR